MSSSPTSDAWYQHIVRALNSRDDHYRGFFADLFCSSTTDCRQFVRVVEGLKAALHRSRASTAHSSALNAELTRRIAELQHQLASHQAGEASDSRVAALERKLNEVKEERIELYRVQGANAQRLLNLNEALKESESLCQQLRAELAARDAEIEGLRALEELVAERDLAAKVLQDELTKMQMELLETEERHARNE